jgi:hypothetical protein
MMTPLPFATSCVTTLPVHGSRACCSTATLTTDGVTFSATASTNVVSTPLTSMLTGSGDNVSTAGEELSNRAGA